MQPWTYYPVFVGTVISIVSLTYFAITQRKNWDGRTLSELATIELKLLSRFRNILLFCGVLFAITMFGFIVPNAPYVLITLILSLIVIICELLVGVIPAHMSTIKIHETLGVLMGLGMLALAYLFWFSFGGNFRLTGTIFAILMTVLFGLMLADRSKRRFVVYELLFIFSSHITLSLAALALR